MFSQLHLQGISSAFNVFRMKRQMSYPGVTASVYPWATHLSQATCNFTAHARTRQTNSASDCGVGSSAVETEKNGRLQGCQLACPIPLSVLEQPLVRLRPLRADRDLHRSRASPTLERENYPNFATSSRKYPQVVSRKLLTTTSSTRCPTSPTTSTRCTPHRLGSERRGRSVQRQRLRKLFRQDSLCRSSRRRSST